MTVLQETVRIHSPVDRVYAIAEDRQQWDQWWVGCHEERLTDTPRSMSLALVTPFPLTERVLEDRIDHAGAFWKVKSETHSACSESDPEHTLVVLGSDQTWTYEPHQSDTEVTVSVDYEPPAAAIWQGLGKTLERMEDDCLKQSLQNLRELCEAC